MRVVVDPNLCDGHGLCERKAPAVFRLGTHDTAVVLQETLPEGLREVMEEAATWCPKGAIHVEEEG